MGTFLAGATLAGFMLLIGWGAYLEHLVRHWDEKITALCDADGGRNVGLRVYERVMAPTNYIRPASGAMPAEVAVPWRYKGKLLRPDEPIVTELVELEVLRDESPRVSKYSSRIVRVSDSKTLAEEVMYIRNGGGIPMPTPSERKTCPNPSLTSIGTNAIYSQVFINHPLTTASEIIK